MEKFVKELLTEKVLNEVKNLYAINELYYVGGFENFIYGFDKDNQSYIVRISHSSHRTIAQIKAEIDFIFYLSNNNANVSTPIFSVNNNLVEKITLENNSYFTVCAYTKAIGQPPSRTNLTESLFYNYGKTIANFHKLTKSYQLKEGLLPRYTWDEDILIKDASKFLDAKDKIILEKLNELIIKINSIERTKDNFGLIHTDIHFGNFFIHNDNLTVFDFDDVAYQYFISDIAIALFYLVYLLNDEEKMELADRFMKNFMKGYFEENKLAKEDFLKINLFLKLREIILYIVIHKTLNIEESKFAQTYINKYRERIINDIEFINLDFEKYYY